MIIRRLTPSDAAAFRSLRLMGWRESASAFGSSYEEECDMPLSTTEARLAPDSGRKVFGAFDGDRLVGIVGLARETALKVRHKAFVYAMYVAQSHRGRGIGRRLMEQVLACAATLDGVQRMTISVTAGNVEAVGLYESLGFIEFGREPDSMNVDGRFYDEIMMSRALAVRPQDGTD